MNHATGTYANICDTDAETVGCEEYWDVTEYADDTEFDGYGGEDGGPREETVRFELDNMDEYFDDEYHAVFDRLFPGAVDQNEVPTRTHTKA